MKTPSVAVPGCIDGDILCEFAAEVNESPQAIERKEWLFVTSAQTLLHTHASPGVRPTDGRDWPVFVESTVDYDSAEQLVKSRNQAILETAKVPRIWFVVVKQVHPGKS
jgi:hypothetical protein